MSDMPIEWQERRRCARCHQVDDHPRHGVGIPVGATGTPQSFHLDCHALMGCPICIHQLRDADGAQGDQLRAHLQTLDPLDRNTIAELLGTTKES